MSSRSVTIIVFLFLPLMMLMSQVNAERGKVSRPDLQERETFFDPDANKPKDEYRFRVEWRVEAQYQQWQHRSANSTYENLFMHGSRVGVTADFMLPHRFSLQTGLLYTFTTGQATQKWGAMSYEDYSTVDPVTMKAHTGNIHHRLYEHQLTIPVRAYYNIHLWKDLNMFFFTGPQIHIGMGLKDKVSADITDKSRAWLQSVGQPTSTYDRYKEKELHRVNVQWGLGGGFEWNRYRLTAGYDFGLNNLVRTKRIGGQKMMEWGWAIGFAIRVN